MLSSVPVAAAQRAFSTTAPKLALNSYAMFLKQRGKDKALKGLGIPQRGKLLAKWYRALSPAEIAKLQKAGANVKTGPRKTKKFRFIQRFQKSVRGSKFAAGAARHRAAERAWAKRH
jgi:hypothetical protein